MTAEPEIDLKAGRRRVARSRGALSGVLLIVLGAWAALIPFVGPYFKFGFSPSPTTEWHWTSGRGLYEVLPGGIAVLAGLVLLFSASRTLTVLMATLAAAAGAWLVVGPELSRIIHVSVGAPGAKSGSDKASFEWLLYFYAIGAAILWVAALALGRLSTHSVRDVRAEQRRAEAEAAEQRRVEDERRAAAAEHDRRVAEDTRAADRRTDRPLADRTADDGTADDRTRSLGRRDGDGRTAALPVTEQHVGDGSHAADTAGPRDAAGSSGYLGHRTPGYEQGAPNDGSSTPPRT